MTAARALADGPLVAFYGDDLTGSSAVMEVTAFAGLETVLFLTPPSAERLAAFPTARVIGIAGMARSQPPQWMREHLPPIFAALESIGAPITHYKVCSTFDSSPEIGSIGCAAEIGRARFPHGWMPMIVGDAGMGRFQVFGHLFAHSQGVGYRLDRHPVMARHPVTPMHESDLRLHLARQTRMRTGLVDFSAIKRGTAETQLAAELAAGCEIIAIDVLDAETMIAAGRLVWERGAKRQFALGSQGFEAALVAYWRAAGLLPPQAATHTAFDRKPIAVVSGSVSPVTALQIATATEAGFAGIALDAAQVVDPRAWQNEIARTASAAADALAQGRSSVVYTAAGPDDPAVGALSTALAAAGLSSDAANQRIGEGLGQILAETLGKTGVRRAVISGGDTSGRAAAMLGIDALTAIAPLAPGAPLCRAHCVSGPFDGMEIALKGGQVGSSDFFFAVMHGSGKP